MFETNSSQHSQQKGNPMNAQRTQRTKPREGAIVELDLLGEESKETNRLKERH
jgi:hypothetical protein